MAGELTRFRPGQSGNPGGRPKSIASLTASLRHVLGEPATRATLEQVLPKAQAARYTDAQIAGLTNAQLLALRTFQLALKGHPEALKLAWHYTDGKPPDVVEDRGEDERRVATIEEIRAAIIRREPFDDDSA